MGTSGSTNFDLTRNELITGALRIVGAIAQGDSASPSQISEGAEALNLLVKSLVGIRLWQTDWVEKTFTASSEVTGTDGKIYTAIRSHTSSTADKPITGANYRSFWFERGSTGGVWAASTAFSAIGDFLLGTDVLWVEKAQFRRSNIDHPLRIGTFREYFQGISSKHNTASFPDLLAVDYDLNSRVFLWPQPNDIDGILQMLQVRKLEDFDAATNNPDMWARWLKALKYGTAADLSDEYGLPRSERDGLKRDAERFMFEARNNEREPITSKFIQSAYPE